MAEIVYDLIKLEDFSLLPSITGEEYIASGRGGTYKVKSKDLIDAVAKQQGFIKATALAPLNSQVAILNSDTAQLKVDVPKKVDKSSVIDNLNTPSSTFVLSARQGKILNDRIADFSGQIGSGILGEAKPNTEPIVSGFGIYTVSEHGTFVNFPDVNGDPIVVTQEDLNSGLVQLWGNDNVWEKHITLVDVFTPVFSNNLSDI